MIRCITTGCDSPRLPGRGRRYCAACQVAATEVRRLDAISRAGRWRKAHPEQYREIAQRTAERARQRGKPCIVGGCTGITGVPGTARGYCSTHYHRWKKTGNPLLVLADLKPKPDPWCSVEGCDKRRWARELCPMHLMRLNTHGSLERPPSTRQRAEGPCSIDDCMRDAVNAEHQLCNPHYLRLQRHGHPLAGGTPQRLTTHCTLPGCEGKFYARGMCGYHWRRVYGARQKARRRDAPGTASGEQIAARVAFYGGLCWLCRRPYEDIDHVKPIDKGGSNWPANLRPACHSCNSRKQARWFGVAHLDELIIREKVSA